MLPRATLELVRQLRSREIDGLQKTLFDSRAAKPVLLLGESGVGKSTILSSLPTPPGTTPASVVDLGAARNRSLLGLAMSLLRDLPPEATGAFFGAAAEAHRTGEERLLRQALTLCEEALRSGNLGQVIFRFDNIDRASPRTRNWLRMHILSNSSLRSISAARDATPDLADISVTRVRPFERGELALLASYWSPHSGLDSATLTTALMTLSGGHPARAALGAWALSARPSLAQGNLPASLAKLVQEIAGVLSHYQRASLGAAVFAYQRLTEEILRLLLGQVATDHFAFLRDLPFAVVIEDALGGVVIHPVALTEISAGLGLGQSAIDEARTQLAQSVYYRLIANPELGSDFVGALQLERLRYVAGIEKEDLQAEIDDAFHGSLRLGRLLRADEVAQLAEDVIVERKASAPLRYTLLVAENDIVHHDIQRAQTTLQGLPPQLIAASSPLVRIRFPYLRGKCITSPAATRGADIFDAAPLFEEAIRLAEQNVETPTAMEELRLELGHAYRLLGRDVDALATYRALADSTKEFHYRIRANEEEANLFRLIQDLDSAEAAYNRVNGIRYVANAPLSSLGQYYLANIKRDQRDYAAAELLYERAHSGAVSDGDDFLICLVHGDWAWSAFHQGETARFKELLTEYRSLAEAYGFSRELAEYWHMAYHLAMEDGDRGRALSALDQALRLARDFGNVLIYLDCLMHQVQRHVSDRQLDAAEGVIAEMKAIEDRGCRYRVFRGRALIYYGDGLVAASDESKAVRAWKTGFEAVAAFGNSGSNVELLSDLFRQRREPFMRLMEKFSISPGWPSNVTPPEAGARIAQLIAD